jgi:hypothetical protein
MATERSLASYLLVSRPAALWAKASVIPLGYLTVHLLGEPAGGVSLATAVVAWLVFDLGIYETRYEYNDLADAEVDRAHVVAAGRGRVPDDPRAHRWTVRVILARLGFSAVVIALLPGTARMTMVVAATGFVCITVGYEAARTSMRRRPLTDWRAAHLAPRDAAVFVLVGGGYGLRAGLGVALAGASGQVVAAIVALAWGLGILAVLMDWTGEAALLRAGGDDGGVLSRKSHIAVLARLIEARPERVDLDRPLLEGRPAWLTAGLLAGTSVFAVAFASSLGTWPSTGSLVVLLVVCVLVSPVVLARWPSLWAGPSVIALNVGAAAVFAASGSRVEMAVVLAYVSAAPAISRSVSVTSVGPGRVLAEEPGVPVTGGASSLP